MVGSVRTRDIKARSKGEGEFEESHGKLRCVDLEMSGFMNEVGIMRFIQAGGGGATGWIVSINGNQAWWSWYISPEVQ